MMARMMLPKLDKALRLMVELERQPASSFELARRMGIGRATVMRLIESLRELGCQVDAERDEAGEWAYYLSDWGVFKPERVRQWAKDQGPVAPTAPQGELRTTGE